MATISIPSQDASHSELNIGGKKGYRNFCLNTRMYDESYNTTSPNALSMNSVLGRSNSGAMKYV